MNPYKIYPKQKPSFFQKLLKKEPKLNGVISINNLLAEKDIQNISIEEIQSIAYKHKINIKKNFRERIHNLYALYLKSCYSDFELSETELRNLDHLKRLFSLTEKEINKINRIISENIYHQEAKKAVEDGELDEKEKQFLERLKNNLFLPEDVAEQIYKNSATEIFQNTVKDISSDGRISPEEESQMNKIARSLGIPVTMDGKSRVGFEKMKLFWLIENGEIPEVESGLNLQRNERCFFHTHCSWQENRTITKRINYGGPSMRIKIAKGFYYNAGSIRAQRVTEDVMTEIDSGYLNLTNKRIIFVGSKTTKNIPLTKIIDFTHYTDGVDIIKDTGKPPFLAFKNNTDVFSAILGRCISEL